MRRRASSRVRRRRHSLRPAADFCSPTRRRNRQGGRSRCLRYFQSWCRVLVAGRSRRYSRAIVEEAGDQLTVVPFGKADHVDLRGYAGPHDRELGDTIAGKHTVVENCAQTHAFGDRGRPPLLGCRIESGDAARDRLRRRVGRARPASPSPVRGGSGCGSSIPRPMDFRRFHAAVFGAIATGPES